MSRKSQRYIPPKSQMIFPKWDWDRSLVTQEDIDKEVAEEQKKLKADAGWQLAQKLFYDKHGNPWVMSPGETHIFNLITQVQHRFAQIVASTQYGKTQTMAFATLTRIAHYPEDWVIVVPDYKRGKIFLDYIIKAAARNSFFKRKLVGVDIGESSKLARLLEKHSKLGLTFQIINDGRKLEYGSINILTTESRKRTDTINAIMGFGSSRIIFDEAAMVDDNIEAGVFRMIAGKGKDTFLLKVGNPFYRNHFYESWKSDGYKKIFINDRIGLAEGRYDEETLRRAKKKKQYDIIFKGHFPTPESVDERGYTALVTDGELQASQEKLKEASWAGEGRLGVDVARGGGDSNVWVYRCGNYAIVLDRNQIANNMDVASQTVRYIKEFNINSMNVYVDDIGVGGGVTDRLHQLDYHTYPVKVSNKVEEPRFKTKKARNYWRMMKWIRSDGRLDPDSDWSDILAVRYKTQARSSGREIRIMPKSVLRQLNIASPDTAEALMLTFERPEDAFKGTDVKEKSGYDQYRII